MASIDGRASFRSTMNKGSDEVFEFSCDPCSTENIHLEAFGYCQTCSEYLCQTCYRCHSKQSVTKSHKLLDKSSTPKTKVAVKSTDTLSVHCTKHPDKPLEYVCNIHDELGCAACMTVNHATCQDKSYVPDVSDNFINNGEWKHLYVDLDNLVSMATELKTETNTAEKENNGYQSKCFAKIRFWRKQIDLMLDKLQNKAEQNVMDLYQDNMDKITNTRTECKSIISVAQNTISALRTEEQDGKKNQLYIDIKLSTKNISFIEGLVHDMKRSCIRRYEIGEMEKLQELESTLSDMLALSVQQDKSVTKARYKKRINVKYDGDTENCSIAGITVLTGGRVVVTDYANKAVKLIDVKNNKVLSRVSVAAPPRDVAQTERDKVVVTLDNSSIVLINVNVILSTQKVIKVPNTNMYGICSYQNNVLVVCGRPPCLKVIDMSGKVVKSIDKNTDRNLFLTVASRLAMNSSQTLIYITDWEAKTVTTLTMDGKIEHIYKSDTLKYPVGVTVGRYGEVFVCSHGTHTLHQLSPTGQFIRVLLGKDQNLAKFPFAIEYRVDENTLYISSLDSKPEMRNNIYEFQLE